MGEWIPVAGSWLDSPAAAKCGGCGRSTWDRDAVGTKDTMRQPDGNPCGGTFVTAAY